MSAAVLVDTSVWIDHFRHGNDELARLLAQDAVLMHPYVLLEVACSTPPAPRKRTLAHLARLRLAQVANPSELLEFIEQQKLHGQGCGMVDVSLLASVRITPGARLWALDKRLATFARRLHVAAENPWNPLPSPVPETGSAANISPVTDHIPTRKPSAIRLKKPGNYWNVRE